MFLNKGKYLHWGGLAHSGFHAIVTWLILIFFIDWNLAGAIATIEFIVHYHMDWFKMWYNKKKGWGPTTHNEFWILLGVDQWVHSITYLWIVWVLYDSGRIN